MEDSAKEQTSPDKALAKATGNGYDKFAEEVFALDKPDQASPSDSDAIVARVVEKLRSRYPELKDQLLFDKARSLYWQWKDSMSGEDEFKSTLCD